MFFTHCSLLSDVSCASEVTWFIISCRKWPFVSTPRLGAALCGCSLVQKTAKSKKMYLLKCVVLIKPVIVLHFQIILSSFLSHSNPQKQNTSAFIKSYSGPIHWLFSMGFLSVSSIRPIKTMTDNNSYKGRTGQGFFSWRGFAKRSHAAERVISLSFFPQRHQQFNWTPQTPEKGFARLRQKHLTCTLIQNSD